MKIGLPLLVALLGSGWASSPPGGRVVLTPLTKAAYLAAKKHGIQTTLRLTFPVKKHGKTIAIPTLAGTRVFRDATVEEDNPGWEKYTYLGYSPHGAYHLILRNHYEWSSYILLQQNGRRIEVPEEPIFSPDSSAFVVISASLDYEMMPNSLQGFRRDKQGWRQVWKLAPKAWEPTQLAWLSNTTLLLKQKQWSDNLGYGRFTYAKLTI